MREVIKILFVFVSLLMIVLFSAKVQEQLDADLRALFSRREWDGLAVLADLGNVRSIDFLPMFQYVNVAMLALMAGLVLNWLLVAKVLCRRSKSLTRLYHLRSFVIVILVAVAQLTYTSIGKTQLLTALLSSGAAGEASGGGEALATSAGGVAAGGVCGVCAPCCAAGGDK